MGIPIGPPLRNEEYMSHAIKMMGIRMKK